MKIGTFLMVAMLVIVWAQPLHSQEPSAADRQAAVAALALLEAGGHLPEEWIAAPAEIVEGDGSLPDFLERRAESLIDPSGERPAPIGLFTCDATRCVVSEGPVPVMVQRLESDERGITLLVHSPSISPGGENPPTFSFYDFMVRVEGLGTDELVVRLLQRAATLMRAPQPSDPR